MHIEQNRRAGFPPAKQKARSAEITGSLILGERHLRRVLTLYSLYYNETRTHLGLAKDAPLQRAVQRSGTVVATPILSRIASSLRADMIFGNDTAAEAAAKQRNLTVVVIRPRWDGTPSPSIALATQLRLRCNGVCTLSSDRLRSMDDGMNERD